MPSQRVAEAYDLWSKTIDRRLGMVHNPLPGAADFLALCSGRRNVERFDYAQRLILAPWPIEEFRAAADSQRTAHGRADAESEAALARILKAGRKVAAQAPAWSARVDRLRSTPSRA